MSDEQPKANTDREVFRDPPGDYYGVSVHITKEGNLGIDVGGGVIVKPPKVWHRLACDRIDTWKLPLEKFVMQFGTELQQHELINLCDALVKLTAMSHRFTDFHRSAVEHGQTLGYEAACDYGELVKASVVAGTAVAKVAKLAYPKEPKA